MSQVSRPIPGHLVHMSGRHVETERGSLIIVEQPLADDEALRRHATVLAVLADAHGLSDLGLGDHPGEIVVSVEPGRTYFDVARFEMAVADMLGITVHVTPSSAPGAHVRARLTAPAAA